MKKISHKSVLFFAFIQTLVKTLIISSCLCVVHAALAHPSKPMSMPGVTVMGLTGDTTAAYADMMFPLFGQAQSFFHLNPQGLLHDGDEYTLSLGGGFRHLTERAGILGAYVFGDYNHSLHGNGFWFVSPGVERLGKVIDFSANLYIPASEQRKNLVAGPGESLSIYDYITFAGHSQYDRVLRTFESTGTGADAEIGFRIAMMNNPKLYVGGYYFDPKDASEKTKGVAARLEAPLTEQLTLVLSDSYDNVQHNTAKLGLQYAFGGRKNSRNFTGNLRERMVDPIHRNLVATSGPSNTGQPIVQTDNKPEEEVLVKDHIAFFDRNSQQQGQGDGTYERPFTDMTQGNCDVYAQWNAQSI